ncbi:hypothetical protein [Bacillus sp. S10(2024)]|uniref:hypothetical protein n=1 Tax=Bacillus sp. S10(2024) TaxID=3162886 RepID=UPI003D1BB6D8
MKKYSLLKKTLCTVSLVPLFLFPLHSSAASNNTYTQNGPGANTSKYLEVFAPEPVFLS